MNNVLGQPVYCLRRPVNVLGQPVNPIAHPFVDLFLMGFIAACSLVAVLFFFRFWRATQDKLFLAFVIFFVVQGAGDVFLISLRHPNLGDVWLFLAHLLAIIAVLAAILVKNSSRT